ncbi:hypothetical protein JVT61DRAFT_13770 [Boletus reticuloceps]|uniref:Uncharacterized protein n=1 Tax=Boletus reticuloceps TaxID=495285 RepID=A0A8I2YUY6_9AGAM|nr:hypothetical protein JVT61DRAFT_13770 [Boletus reticuloceps]
MQSNYRLFYEVITLVITHLERELDINVWWTRNLPSLEKYGVRPAGHACVTGLPLHGKYAESKVNVELMPADSWLIDFLRFFGLFAHPKKHLKKQELLKVPTKRCRLNPEIAQELAERLART